MNYGGTGPAQYGQPAMAGPGPQQMPHGMPGQQRMMMPQAGSMRSGPGPAMYNAGMPGQPGMMNPQGGMNPMYSGHPAMATSQHQQLRHQQMQQEMLRNFPEGWRTNIMKETNMEKKNKMFAYYASMYNQQRTQQVPGQGHPGQMGQMVMHGGMPVYNQMPGMMAAPGMSKPLHGVPPHSMAQHPTMRMGGPQPGMQPMPIPAPNNQHLVNAQQQQQTVPSPQVASISSQSQQITSGSPMMPHGMSPQVNAQQPSTPQNPASVQPGSVGDGVQQPSSVGQNERTPEYENLLKELREKFYDQLKRVDERCGMDNTPKPKGLERLMEVLDNKRTVAYDLLTRAYSSTISMLEKQSLSFGILEEIKKIGEPAVKNEQGVKIPTIDMDSLPSNRPQGVDPWGPVRHLMIKVPDAIKNAINETNLSRKRRSEEAGIVEVPPAKAPKPDPVLPPLVASKSVAKTTVDPNLFGERGDRIADSTEDDDDYDQEPQNQNNGELESRTEIACVNGRKWRMSATASQELAGLPWRADPDAMPQSWRSPDIVICFDSHMLLCSPLRVLVPASYPLEPPVIQFDRSFPDGPMSKQMASIFERTLSLYPARTLTSIFESFKSTCQEMIRLKSFSGHYVPNEHQQKQLVA